MIRYTIEVDANETTTSNNIRFSQITCGQ